MRHKTDCRILPLRHLMGVMKLALAITLTAMPFSGQADIRGLVVRILDGDTIEILQDNGERTRVRLNGIDAPEKGQPFGQRSRQALTTLTAGKRVYVEGNKLDRYSRLLGTVWYDTKDINAVQIKNGMAWAYRYRGKAMLPAYAGLEETARKNRSGLWAEPAPVEPWRWRKMHSKDKENDD